MRLGGGLLVVLAVGAAGAGYWVLAGVVLAAVVAAVVSRLPALGDTPLERYVGAFTRLALVVVQAIVFGAYVVPAQPAYAGAGLVLVVAVADLAGLRLPAALTRWLTVVLIAAAVVLIVLCAVVAPVVTSTPIGTPSPAAVVVSALITLPFLLPVAPDRVSLRALTLGGLAVLVTIVALVQLGPDRLGLSATSIRDLLYAADAGQLQPLLTVVVVLATVPATLTTFTDARERYAPERGWESAAGIVLALAAALFASPYAVLVAAGLGTVVELVLRARNRRYRVAHE
ncbi:sulfatase [Amycolatopsis sp. FDAARGOS 1241]|uniref:sulfatase n=1 Tax=Amycolatopsis sp. FDAARGOS 1241 TaxID=2778070 RepID=UPI0019525563|nr:sulfatase [Amycolatopsis sp. FDAARGOS 1241]QRP44228.1 sulfatase [Amycolatopsis sp. FDAARGOS 1241]